MKMTKQEAIEVLDLYSGNRFGIVPEPFWMKMTKQEAIEVLDLYSGNRSGIVSEPFWKALNIALEALKSQNSDEPDWENEAPE